MTEKHLSTQFDAELSGVSTRVLEMGGLVEAQVTQSIQALQQLNNQVAKQVLDAESRVNQMEVEIDRDLNSIIARRQPTARDLRLLIAVSKVIGNLERIGDEATKIARMGKLVYASDRLQQPRWGEVRRMAGLALEMLRMALDSFARLDASTPAQVVRKDREVDEEFRGILRQLITFMMEDPRTISMFIEILFVAKAIERIGDHAKNIAEFIIYIVKGTDVRHTTVEELEREARG